MSAKELTPRIAGELALDVYAINGANKDDLKVFLTNKLFAKGKGNQKTLTADVGGRILRAAKDGFGLCARGVGTYEGDLFLIFRGTTGANNGADFVTDARI